ncbi:MAG: hypothetical protein AB8H79_10080 [Myxococcota bacterium]
MARPKMTQQKRARETQRRERAELKAARRAQRKAEAENANDDVPEGDDPDLVGIVAGPQPIRAEFLDDEEEEAEKA